MRILKIDRHAMRPVVLNLLDHGFTVPAIAFMLNKGAANIYAHLRSAGRLKEGNIVRYFEGATLPETRTCIGRLFADGDAACGYLLTSAQQTARLSRLFPPVSRQKDYTGPMNQSPAVSSNVVQLAPRQKRKYTKRSAFWDKPAGKGGPGRKPRAKKKAA